MPRLSKARKEQLNTMMKESIFEAATSVLCKHGVDGTTMNRVAAAAELSKSSLYDYFPSKEELLAFVSERIVAPFLEMLEDVVRIDLPAPQKLETILRTAFDQSTKHKAVIRLLMQSNQEHQVKKECRPRILEAFTSIFEQGIEGGFFHPHNPAYTGRMLLGSLVELFELQASNASDEATSEYVAALIDAVLHGLSIHVEKGPTPNKTSSSLPSS